MVRTCLFNPVWFQGVAQPILFAHQHSNISLYLLWGFRLANNSLEQNWTRGPFFYLLILICCVVSNVQLFELVHLSVIFYVRYYLKYSLELFRKYCVSLWSVCLTFMCKSIQNNSIEMLDFSSFLGCLTRHGLENVSTDTWSLGQLASLPMSTKRRLTTSLLVLVLQGVCSPIVCRPPRPVPNWAPISVGSTWLKLVPMTKHGRSTCPQPSCLTWSTTSKRHFIF